MVTNRRNCIALKFGLIVIGQWKKIKTSLKMKT